MNLGFSGEIGFLLLLALVLFGPRKLAEFSRQAGKLMAEFRRASSNLQNQIQNEIGKLDLDEIDPAKHLAPVLSESNAALDQLSLTGTLERLTEKIASFSLEDKALPTEEHKEQQSTQQIT